MRIDDICLVVADIDRADAFYSGEVALEPRMRNVRFADFRLGDGARLALWEEWSIAETVGAAYPTGSGMPFTVTLELPGAARDTLTDPDGFTIIRKPSPTGQSRLAAATLAVTDLARSAAFLGALGFAVTGTGADSMTFGAGAVELTIVLHGGSGAPVAALASGGAGGHVMLAIELETGPEVDALAAELRALGLVASGPPQVFEWGARSTYFVDHDGYIWEIYAWVETPR
ncbi:hypothetical protein B7R54_15285 [Subtercola boreus]|uniref:VOC domain-containing protein n=1 Tax=Subtercola boreus TaxID=120213 RepID=A0A3E0VLA2_9MICO|nr:VOC family protein [Subtercola boreus]RFA10415.1 hypothetical protein B7R54_15285 [Subtercola boreus]TQL56063.1 glyoxalase/bleomycin resistance protein/dioxygenase superfamily protein [Subtercola boreus]